MDRAVHYVTRNTSLGLLAMAASGQGVCAVEFGDSEQDLHSKLSKEVSQNGLNRSDGPQRPDLETWADALVMHLDAGTGLREIPLDIHGTDFDKRVWNELRKIPKGQTIGYSQLAAAIGRPKAVRAAASACGRNRIGILIPCHRVLRADGQLGGYRWGLSRKQALLRSEQNASIPQAGGAAAT